MPKSWAWCATATVRLLASGVDTTKDLLPLVAGRTAVLKQNMAKQLTSNAPRCGERHSLEIKIRCRCASPAAQNSSANAKGRTKFQLLLSWETIECLAGIRYCSRGRHLHDEGRVSTGLNCASLYGPHLCPRRGRCLLLDAATVLEPQSAETLHPGEASLLAVFLQDLTPRIGILSGWAALKDSPIVHKLHCVSRVVCRSGAVEGQGARLAGVNAWRCFALTPWLS